MWWVKSGLRKAGSPDENATDTTENNDEKKENSKTYRMVAHWARMAPAIEGGIEAPIQFLFQVGISTHLF